MLVHKLASLAGTSVLCPASQSNVLVETLFRQQMVSNYCDVLMYDHLVHHVSSLNKN